MGEIINKIINMPIVWGFEARMHHPGQKHLAISLTESYIENSEKQIEDLFQILDNQDIFEWTVDLSFS